MIIDFYEAEKERNAHSLSFTYSRDRHNNRRLLEMSSRVRIIDLRGPG
jgi:hypothetical protein